MATTIDQAFVKQFEREVHESFQRQGSKLRNTVRVINNVNGSSAVFQKVGKGTASTKSTHGVVPVMNLDHSSIEVTLQDFYAGDWIDKLDELKLNIDERQVIANAGAMTQEQITEANRHLETMTGLRTKHFEHLMDEMHQSIRKEIASEDKYVRRMRPTFGYLMAATWAAQMLGLAYVMVFRTSEASLILNAVESLSVIWTVGLSVLGIYVYKRSEDKKIQLSSTRSLVSKASQIFGPRTSQDEVSANINELTKNLNS